MKAKILESHWVIWWGYIYANAAEIMVVKKVDRSEVQRRWVRRGQIVARNPNESQKIPAEIPKSRVSSPHRKQARVPLPFHFLSDHGLYFCVLYIRILVQIVFLVGFFFLQRRSRNRRFMVQDVAVHNHSPCLPTATYFWLDLEQMRTDMWYVSTWRECYINIHRSELVRQLAILTRIWKRFVLAWLAWVVRKYLW